MGYMRIFADDIESRMNSLGVGQMTFGTYRSVEDIVKSLQGVTLDSINNYIQSHVDLSKFSLMTLGKESIKWEK